MANTFTCLSYHIIFSTKNREPFLIDDHKQRLWGYLEALATDNSALAPIIGGTENHIHILCGLAPTQTIATFTKNIKALSTLWIKSNLPNCQNFAWQDGYAAFTVSQSQRADLITYIQNQTEHHRSHTFVDKHALDYKAEYLLG